MKTTKTKFHALTIAAMSLLLVGATLLSGCSTTPDHRIRRNQELYNSLPPEAQAAIRAGRVEVGFTPDMVLLALGKPASQHTRTSEQGTTEVWTYGGARSSSSSVSVGLGFGSVGRRSSTRVNTAFGFGGGGARSGETARILFQGGKVTSVEQSSLR